MTDYEYVINTDFTELIKKNHTSGVKIRKELGLERDKERLIRFGEIGNTLELTLTTRINGIRINVPSSCLVDIPLFSFKTSYSGKEIFYLTILQKRFNNFKEILNKLSEEMENMYVDFLIVSDYFKEVNFLEILKENRQCTLDISCHFSDLVDTFHYSPVKPNNYRELLRLYNNLYLNSIPIPHAMEIPTKRLKYWTYEEEN